MTAFTPQKIEKMIYIVRGQKVMLDSDLAELYGVETKALKRAVRRNMDRFPKDFMFELSDEELKNWRYQFGTSNREVMGIRYKPFAFTEPGIAMLSSVLNSSQAIQVNISIIRIFIKMRNFLASEESLTDKVAKLEEGTDKLFRIVFERLDQVEANVPLIPKGRKKIGLR